MDPVRVRACAKINLGLKVMGRRGDGYHDILSVFQTLDLHDLLTFEPAETGRIEIVCDDAGMPTDRENLIYRAVEALWGHIQKTPGVRVTLEKRIPVGGGLGGGSSDAAATLVTLNRLWASHLPEAELYALAGELGSDVPFFLRYGTAIVTGRGERFRYVPWRETVHYILVTPGFQVSSGWAYRNLKIRLTETSKYVNLLRSAGDKDICPAMLLGCLENDFLPLLVDTYPEVGPILDALKVSGASACSLSGSGSTLYGVFETHRLAEDAAADLRARGYRVTCCRAEGV